jgi:hypothetical protein
MRRKPSPQGNYNNNNNNNGQQRKARYPQSGGGNSGGSSHGQNRPRKNYAAAREKYLSQARDSLAAGDRVLAENYFQHADHCYRMMVEEGYNNRNNNPQHANQSNPNQADNQNPAPEQGEQVEEVQDNINRLPAIITTAAIEEERNQQQQEPVIVQGWEE